LLDSAEREQNLQGESNLLGNKLKLQKQRYARKAKL